MAHFGSAGQPAFELFVCLTSWWLMFVQQLAQPGFGFWIPRIGTLCSGLQNKLPGTIRERASKLTFSLKNLLYVHESRYYRIVFLLKTCALFLLTKCDFLGIKSYDARKNPRCCNEDICCL